MDVDIRTGYYWYGYPCLYCRICSEEIHLPYGDLPQTDLEELSEKSESDLLDLPQGEWSAFFACCECGRLDRYERRHICLGIEGKNSRPDSATMQPFLS